jgi:2-keto-4-pentenoate hydratase/2-oxohepta-3-ene-1,7-dioic acid hydratase in catechol pathway
MRIAIFDDHRVGAVEGDRLWDLTELVPGWNPELAPYLVNHFIGAYPERRDAIAGIMAGAEPLPLDSVRLRPAVPRPTSFFAAPLNYRAHVSEMRGPLASGGGTARELGFFLKSSSAVTGPADPIELPDLPGRRFDYEGELVVVIGKPGRAISRRDALAHVFGYTLTVDATLRMTETQREERTYRKSFWSFAPLGPWVVTADELPDPTGITVEVLVNGERRQQAALADLILDVPALIEQASKVVPLQPGDVFATGSPAGVGQLHAGDEVRVRSPQIGELRLAVTERDW